LTDNGADAAEKDVFDVVGRGTVDEHELNANVDSIGQVVVVQVQHVFYVEELKGLGAGEG
jgi:hypothetical protein